MNQLTREALRAKGGRISISHCEFVGKRFKSKEPAVANGEWSMANCRFWEKKEKGGKAKSKGVRANPIDNCQ
jgi:hypothetical protein